MAIEITTKWGNLFWKINFQLISILSRKEKNLPIFVVISNYLLLSNENEFRGGVEVFLRFFFVLIYFEFIISIDSFNLYSLVGFLFDSFLVVNNISSNFYFVHFWCGGGFDGFVIIQSTKKKVSTVPVLISNPSFITVRRNKKKNWEERYEWWVFHPFQFIFGVSLYYANLIYFHFFSLKQTAQHKCFNISLPLCPISLYFRTYFFLFVRSFVRFAISPHSRKQTQQKNIKWHTLSREEQSRYYEMARQQRQLHMQLYPNWTMRDSVASGAARKRRNKRDKAADGGI